ncbi:MAG: phosphohydrolase [Cyanobacteria bacterium SW_9_44_58]|nr:MAG: phosphohydrolase [Cyanobacteria bacterium SW_9_44_58]
MQLSFRFDRALTFASELHREQVRKGSNVPYMTHLLGVCSLVLEYGGDEDCAIAALLHDAIEDQGGIATRDKIFRDFGERVTAIVEACTDADEIPKPPWRERKEAYIAHIPKMSSEATLVSVADKVHNASSIIKDYRVMGEEIWQRFQGKKQGTLWYYRALTNAFRQREVTPIVEELTQVVEQLESLS